MISLINHDSSQGERPWGRDQTDPDSKRGPARGFTNQDLLTSCDSWDDPPSEAQNGCSDSPYLNLLISKRVGLITRDNGIEWGDQQIPMCVYV